ncbi:ATP-binding protein [Caulobacter vibrioides]|uniref:histidine kinase n=2 Tax=Caulobacter vibrioides TaxID=155892 RepID=Q9A5C9_CAUVC|nr:ATP-binding protein [Caulobacter vibrioides]YP_002517979.1 hybrid sensor histidine kinase/receiver domain protein [Caulobacter vibrioides NA1000]AAK24492.1 sensor histidine kinase/response regulator [Caulobacter vibrioides CB15]ACL96071.1 hybrid sensor histidine kinase/receiver domain protein [Caulobacter vibrioides NA1000]ATC29373.1 hybrid sensor histidine kinase/response regulator [Caulobacter vibrioides]QXZ50885.1 response regulator [Caulobacter vibrioides]
MVERSGAGQGAGLDKGSGAIAGVTAPLARRLLTTVAILSIAVTSVATAAAFIFVRESAADTQTRHLAEYVGERVKTEDRLFSDLVKVHDAASESLTRRLDHTANEPMGAEFQRLYPEKGDGTRRSEPKLYDGVRTGGHYTHGLGAYLRDAATISPPEQALFVAAADVVATTGEAQIRHYDNFYFFTPQTRLVMFGPLRQDRLQYYRRDAPNTLDISKEEMTTLTLPENNPERVMKCTKLRRLISDPSGRGLNAACMTPFYYKGQFMGAFGTSLSLDSYLLRAVADALPGGSNMIVADDGEVVAAQGLQRNGFVDADLLRRFEAENELKNLIARIRAEKRDVGAVLSPDGDRLVAYGRLVEPGWWFLMSFPSSDIVWSSLKTASWVLLFGFFGVLLQVLLLYRLTHQMVAAPLEALADAQQQGDPAAARPFEARPDEIGSLARALRRQRERNEELLRSLEQRVAVRTAELERANQAKSVFLANMSHELRTPLNGVIAIGDRLAEEEDPQARRELASLVTSSGRLLEQVLGDILDVSKIEAGQFQLSPAPFDLVQLVRSMAELHAAAAKAKQLSLRWSVSPDAEGSYDGDAGRISQILSNLLANAVKFTAKGEVSLEVDRQGEALRFVVRDTGVGFDDAVRDRLFKRFVQADQSITRQFGGTGLGLSICAALAEMMQGSISADAVPGQGARFEVVLPLPRCAEVADVAVEEDREISLEGMRVLVAEDHPTNRKVVEIVLEPFGVDLTMVEDGQAALDALEQGRFDAVLMDMQMPVMDGLSATRAIRAREKASGAWPILVVMLTANAMEEHVAAARSAGADLHLAKPLHPAQLLEALARAHR